MADIDPDQKLHEKITHDLARTVIKEPLYSQIKAEARFGPKAPPDTTSGCVIIEGNDEYYLGKSQAFDDLEDLVKSLVARQSLTVPAYSAAIDRERPEPLFQSDLAGGHDPRTGGPRATRTPQKQRESRGVGTGAEGNHASPKIWCVF